MNWNQKEAEAALARGASLQDALRLGLPFADQLLVLAGGNAERLQELWLWATETEMGAQSEPTMYVGEDVGRQLEDSLTLLKKGMRKIHEKERKSNRARRRLEHDWASLTSKGANDWP